MNNSGINQPLPGLEVTEENWDDHYHTTLPRKRLENREFLNFVLRKIPIQKLATPKNNKTY